MRRESLDQLIEVSHIKYEQCSYTVQLTFFQIVYVVSGSGELLINNNRMPYYEGNLMLLTPKDEYRFEIGETTEFLMVKFSRKYVSQHSWRDINCIECVLYHASHVLGCVLKNKPDEPIVKSISEALIQELKNDDIYSYDTKLHFANALIAIAARNLTKMRTLAIGPEADHKIHAMIDYIQANIFTPDKLRAAVIAKKFGVSESYLGPFFKRQSGETLSGFIAGYKIRLLEHKLRFSDSRINELVAEFQFTDESHLNKFFKRHKGIGLNAFRKLSQDI